MDKHQRKASPDPVAHSYGLWGSCSLVTAVEALVVSAHTRRPVCYAGWDLENGCRQETQNTRTQQETEVWHSVCHTAPLYLLTKQVTKNLPITHTEGVREMGGNIDKETIAAARVSKGLSCSLLPDPVRWSK